MNALKITTNLNINLDKVCKATVVDNVFPRRHTKLCYLFMNLLQDSNIS